MPRRVRTHLVPLLLFEDASSHELQCLSIFIGLFEHLNNGTTLMPSPPYIPCVSLVSGSWDQKIHRLLLTQALNKGVAANPFRGVPLGSLLQGTPHLQPSPSWTFALYSSLGGLATGSIWCCLFLGGKKNCCGAWPEIHTVILANGAVCCAGFPEHVLLVVQYCSFCPLPTYFIKLVWHC